MSCVQGNKGGMSAAFHRMALLAVYPMACIDISIVVGTEEMLLKRKVVIAINSAWNILNFRSGLIQALVRNGYEVVAVAPMDKYADRLADLGCRFEALPMDNHGTHPGRDFLLLLRYYFLLRRERASVYLGYTVKPNVYGSLAAHALGIPVINNISGLGAVFIKESLLTRIVRSLYRLALSRSACVFFQNGDDHRMFVDGRLVRSGITDLLPGSGVDLLQFRKEPMPYREEGGLRFLLVARMLWDKGVGEYVEAARLVKRRYPSARFCLLGFLDVKNPAAISRSQIDEWVADGLVEYLGISDNVAAEISESDCVVLPSYREGTSRTLLEALAVGRPIITTNVTGCREVVEDGVNGYLCLLRDPEDLAEKMEKMISLTPVERAEMGREGREKAEREFDEKIVIDKYLRAIEKVLSV